MTHETDCPARYGCCPNDEYGCVIHAEPPCNCPQACLSCGQDRGHWSDYCTPCCLNGKADEHASAPDAQQKASSGQETTQPKHSGEL